MRPKKPILLYCADQELLSATAFALRLHPYQVTATEDSMEASLAAADRYAAFFCIVLIHAQQGDLAGRVHVSPSQSLDSTAYSSSVTCSPQAASPSETARCIMK